MSRVILAWFILQLARLWVRSLRVRRLGPVMNAPSVAAFWHGDQLPLLRARPNAPESVAVSLSRDGSLQAFILARLGMNVIRGSSSRGSLALARGLLGRLALGDVALMAVDGPRGPRHTVKPGAIFLSRKASAPIYPVGVAANAAVRLSRSWDAFLLPWPFSRICICVGEPWHPGQGLSLAAQCAVLEKQLQIVEKRAREGLRTSFS